jgi:hypothetical protein
MHSKSAAAELFYSTLSFPFLSFPFLSLLSSYYIYMEKTIHALLLILFAAIITSSQFAKCPAANSLAIASGTTLYIQIHLL